MGLKLKVFDSGSNANMYLLKGVDESLLLEAGLSSKKKIKEALLNEWQSIRGCLLTHEHKDHSRMVNFIGGSGIDCYMSHGTNKKLINHHRFLSIPKNKNIYIGTEWCVTGFDVKHDADEPLGFHIHHFPTSSNTLFVTDTYYVKYVFKKLDNIIVECNYSEKLLDPKTPQKNYRLLDSHFELYDCLNFLGVNNTPRLKNVILIHLSNSGSDSVLFKSEAERITKKNVYIAEKNLEVDL